MTLDSSITQNESVNSVLSYLKDNLSEHIPEIEFQHKAELIAEINSLKRQKKALILGHNYMEVSLFHTVCDVKGDSLELSRKAVQVEKGIETLVFCGVEFMAETAKLLSPEKNVLIPSQKAGCSLASSITAADVRALKDKYPGVPVVTYINTYADVKAETDVCCTSGNAVKIINAMPGDSVIFLPDEYLAKNVAKETGKSIIFPNVMISNSDNTIPEQADIISWNGKCEVHDQFQISDIQDARAQYPDVQILAHPECPPEIVDASDFSGSTSKMIDRVKSSHSGRFLLLTECAMSDNIQAETRDRDIEFLSMCSVRCPHMNQITLEQTRDALKFDQYPISLDPKIIEPARRSIERMLEMS